VIVPPPANNSILHVTDFHIGAPYGGIALTPKQFIELAKKSTTLENFVKNARLPSDSPLAMLAENIKTAGAIVMTGDIIEFINQAPHDDEDLMLEVGLEFHRLLLASAEQKPVYEVLGNHERYKPYEKALKALHVKHPNFQVNHDHFLIGDALFIHGDRDLTPYSMEGDALYNSLDGKKDLAPYYTTDGRAYQKRNIERYRHADDEAWHEVANQHVPGIIARNPRLHRLLEITLSPLFPNADPLLYTTPNQLNILHHNLSARLRKDFDRVKHVFSGHTHIPYANIEYDFRGRKFLFHNSGGAIKGSPDTCKPLMIEMANDHVKDVKQVVGKAQFASR
jgi:hypothetical protein